MSDYTDLFNLYKEQLDIILSRGGKLIEGLKISRENEKKVFSAKIRDSKIAKIKGFKI